MNAKHIIQTTTVSALLAVAGHASAQDRMVEAIGVTPSAGAQGFYDITAVWSCGIMDSTAPMDLSGVLELRVNGQLVDRIVLNGGTFGGSGFCETGGSGCGGSCGTGYYDGIFQGALLCVYDGPIAPGVPDCDCRFPSLTSNFPGVPLVPDDEVVLTFTPIIGATADPFSGNNIRRVVFDGVGHYWGRTLSDIRVIPDAAGGPKHSIEVESASWSAMNGTYNMGGELVLLVNGVQVATVPSINDWITAGACVGGGCQSSPCAVDAYGYPLAYCTPNGPETCVPDCYWDSFNPDGPEFSNIALSPGDQILVILRPAPGALPELPGFPDDDQEGAVFCPGDATGDGKVTVEDLNLILSKWNQNVEPGAEGDLTGNGTVDVDDLNMMLAHWGTNCFPV